MLRDPIIKNGFMKRISGNLPGQLAVKLLYLQVDFFQSMFGCGVHLFGDIVFEVQPEIVDALCEAKESCFYGCRFVLKCFQILDDINVSC